MNKRTKTTLRRWCLYGWTFAKWTMAASAIGVVCGLIGTMFHFGVHEVTAFRGTHPWVLYLLPLAGFVIVSFYKLTETDGLGTDDIIDAVHEGKRLPRSRRNPSRSHTSSPPPPLTGAPWTA